MSASHYVTSLPLFWTDATLIQAGEKPWITDVVQSTRSPMSQIEQTVQIIIYVLNVLYDICGTRTDGGVCI